MSRRRSGCGGVTWTSSRASSGSRAASASQAGRAPRTVQTKSRRGVREMPFLPVVAEALASQLARSWRPVAGTPTTSSSRPERSPVHAPEHHREGDRGGRGTRWPRRRHPCSGACGTSFCTFVAEVGHPAERGCGADGARRADVVAQLRLAATDAQARRENVAKLTALWESGCGPEVDQRLTRCGLRDSAANRSSEKTKGPHLRAFLVSPLTDSNRRPPPYHGGALPTELRGQRPQGTKAIS